MIIGHEQIRGLLSHRIKNNPDGVFLFHGPPCIGKKTIAYEISRQLLCLEKKETCKCQSCRLMLSGRHPDFLGIGNNGRIKVSDIDTVLDFVSTTALLSNKKMIIADNVQDMTPGSLNRMLNLLENFKAGTFFLISSDINLLPVTILSRCESYAFKALRTDQYSAIIHKNMGYDKAKSDVLGNLISELPLNTMSKIGLCLKYRNQAFEVFNNTKKKEIIDILEEIDSIDKEDISLFIDMLIIINTDLLMIKNNYINLVNKDIEEKLITSANLHKNKALLWSVSLLSQIKKYAVYGINLNMALKNVIMKTYEAFR